MNGEKKFNGKIMPSQTLRWILNVLLREMRRLSDRSNKKSHNSKDRYIKQRSLKNNIF